MAEETTATTEPASDPVVADESSPPENDAEGAAVAAAAAAGGPPPAPLTYHHPGAVAMAVPSAATAARAAGDAKAPPGDEYEEIREQDRYLPIANISRIMKNQLPENAKIAKDSKETVQECVSEFISFITSEASDKCMQEKRKTINGDDLLWAMSTLGFDKYVEPLKIYLSKYREAVRGDKPEKGGGAGAASLGRPPARAAMAGEGVGVPQPPPSKKSKFG
mmetsp:Transcript_29449/g.62053  ORF Transcript_29449/g.62053 Transcript_29449/m.62053 type:complete len:221 (-) Transcript_29449:172-834(-)